MMRLRTWAATAAVVALAGTAQAAAVFQGRLADGTASSTCTVSGADKCAMFYNTTLNYTILNDWNIGNAHWSMSLADPSPSYPNNLVEAAGASQTDFTGWMLATGNGSMPASEGNQYRSIWDDVGGTLAGLRNQFDGVQDDLYTSAMLTPGYSAWVFRTGDGLQFIYTNVAVELSWTSFYVVAVRPGDVAASVPEPQTLALALLALGGTLVSGKRRPRVGDAPS